MQVQAAPALRRRAAPRLHDQCVSSWPTNRPWMRCAGTKKSTCVQPLDEMATDDICQIVAVEHNAVVDHFGDEPLEAFARTEIDDHELGRRFRLAEVRKAAQRDIAA